MEGFKVVKNSVMADLTVINSCVVTRQAEAKTRGAIAASKRISPEGKIAVVGCYSQLLSDQLLSFSHVDLVLGQTEKYKIVNYLKYLNNGENKAFVQDIKDNDTFPPSGIISSGSRTRANVKIQDGCNFKCSYCIVPTVRGAPRSREFNDSIVEIKRLSELGYKEVVLTGVNIGCYESSNGKSLSDLIEAILAKTGIDRLRLSSIEPNMITDNLLDILSSSRRICSHLHISLQHGSDEILKAMHRKYTTTEYREVVEKVADKMPGACIGADVIVGYPGESKETFQNMYDYIEDLQLTYLHVFRFSPRSGTAAYRLKDDVPEIVKKKRSNMLRNLSNEKRRIFIEGFIGRNLNVLLETRINSEYIKGYSDNYIKFKVRTEQDLENTIVEARLVGIENNIGLGEIISD